MLITAEGLRETIARCSENLSLHGHRLRVNVPPPASGDDIAKASLAIGLPIEGSYRHFLQIHNGIRLDVERPAKPSNDMLQVFSTRELVSETTFVNASVIKAYEDAGGRTFLRRYIVCGGLMDADAMLDVDEAASSGLVELPLVLSRPGDIWMRSTPLPRSAPSFEAWLTASLESMATTSFGFDYEAEVPEW